ncbi:MAG: hypothetical protein ACTHMM_00210 [Agriterribacter sp.]
MQDSCKQTKMFSRLNDVGKYTNKGLEIVFQKKIIIEYLLKNAKVVNAITSISRNCCKNLTSDASISMLPIFVLALIKICAAEGKSTR